MDGLVICTCSPDATPRSMSGHAYCCPLDEAWRKNHLLERLPRQPHDESAESFEIKQTVTEPRVVGRINFVVVELAEVSPRELYDAASKIK